MDRRDARWVGNGGVGCGGDVGGRSRLLGQGATGKWLVGQLAESPGIVMEGDTTLGSSWIVPLPTRPTRQPRPTSPTSPPPLTRCDPADPPAITPDRFDAVLFDLDGVLTRTASLHATAWAELFDGYLRSVDPDCWAVHPGRLRHVCGRQTPVRRRA